MLIKDKCLIILVLVFICACSNKNENEKIFKKYLDINFEKYAIVYNAIYDSNSVWTGDTLRVGIYSDNFLIDSCLIFNKDSNRFYSTINIKNKEYKDATMDEIHEFGGAKIKGKWYFFWGATLVVPREFYQDSIYSPLTFEELSGVAHRNYHQAALIQNADGSFKAKEAFFDKYLSPLAHGSWEDKPRNIVDSMIVAEVLERRQQKIDPKEIAEIKASMAASVRPKEPHYIKLTLQKLGDNIAHLFE